jgi:outer membrane protein
MKMQAVVPVIAALLMTPAVWAQAAAPAAAGKVGVINIQAAIASTAEGKQAAAELQSQFTPRMNELQNVQKQIEDVRNRLQSGQSTLSDEEKARLQREGDTLTRTYQRKQQDLQEDTNDAQQDVVNRIGRKLVDILNKYSKDNGYAIVLDDSSQQTPVIYAANQIDVTQDIIRLFDQSYPVKNAGAAAPTAPRTAPRPAPGTPAAAPKQ